MSQFIFQFFRILHPSANYVSAYHIQLPPITSS